MTARISVIIPVYRRADIVGDAIKSALDQTVPCDVIVVDDASQDGTVEAVRAAIPGAWVPSGHRRP
ncbi:MAG: glycosyltransferase, partial [Pseudomonadota bacterium]